MNDEIKKLADGIHDALDDKKALDIDIIDISAMSDIAEYFVLATASNPNQMDAMQDSVDEYMTKAGHPARSIEGRIRDGSNWILMDYGDIIVHIFDREAREFYSLDRLWREHPSD